MYDYWSSVLACTADLFPWETSARATSNWRRRQIAQAGLQGGTVACLVDALQRLGCRQRGACSVRVVCISPYVLGASQCVAGVVSPGGAGPAPRWWQLSVLRVSRARRSSRRHIPQNLHHPQTLVGTAALRLPPNGHGGPPGQSRCPPGALRLPRSPRRSARRLLPGAGSY